MVNGQLIQVTGKTWYLRRRYFCFVFVFESFVSTLLSHSIPSTIRSIHGSKILHESSESKSRSKDWSVIQVSENAKKDRSKMYIK